MLVQARPPSERQRISRLQDRPQLPPTSALHKAHVAPMTRRQDLQDYVGFAVPPRADDDSLFGPFHTDDFTGECRPVETSGFQPVAGLEYPPYGSEARAEEHQRHSKANSEIHIGDAIKAPTKTADQIDDGVEKR